MEGKDALIPVQLAQILFFLPGSACSLWDGESMEVNDSCPGGFYTLELSMGQELELATPVVQLYFMESHVLESN